MLFSSWLRFEMHPDMTLAMSNVPNSGANTLDINFLFLENRRTGSRARGNDNLVLLSIDANHVI